MINLLKALAEFQQEVPTIHEDTKGYNYTYANLGQIFKVIKPLLKKHGLGFTQLLDGTDLKTIIYHIKSGETLESSVFLPTATMKGMNVYQSNGSAITYYRRYSLSTALGLITDKDIDSKGEQEPSKLRLLSTGYDFLISDKSTKEDIQKALDNRIMETEQRGVLTDLLKTK